MTKSKSRKLLEERLRGQLKTLRTEIEVKNNIIKMLKRKLGEK
jgi:hypothetical protein